ncbi:branched-chain amino acid ABC transporter permease [Halomicroarcula limicola]|uniref:Branched-chain amino acid ABC transporter permease n=1 Tax=Haloarcula limicola TaxID=1429915 RepID=A0A8J7Y8C4_9EURY|nr:branched-chain amino acid ABC transporter permease [Halomicroarcula limicola]MBV0925957.1 branched-chain amino acid ABC transporter permease [Halomicroarcula limicola]
MGVRDLVGRRFSAHAQTDVLSGRVRLGLFGAGVVAVLFAPVAQVVHPFWMDLVTHMFIFALFALSLDFVFGYAGLLSFGHAAMFGAGGYAAALLIQNVTASALLVLPAAIVVGAVVAAIIGWLSVSARGIYFAMLTLAFAQLFYTIAFNDIPAMLLGVEAVTNGDNGLVGITSLTLFGMDTGSLMSYYYLSLAILAGMLAVVTRLANSPFGRVLQAIRENEDRVAFIGYNVDRYKIVAFTISGAMAGLAGGLWVPFNSTATTSMLHWTTSGELIVMTLLGGMGTLWGPIAGAFLVVFLEDSLSAIGNWEIYLGIVYIVIVIFAPRGLAGIFQTVRKNPHPKVLLRRAGDALTTYREKVFQ